MSRQQATQKKRTSHKVHNPRSSSSKSSSSTPSRTPWRVVNATAGDHPMIHQFLVSVFHKPSPVEFQAQLEEPTYEPSDRLLIKDGNRIVAHARLLNREMRYGQLILPVSIVADLATLPEYREQGCASALLSAARKAMAQNGAALGLVETNRPRFFIRRGWVVNGRHCYSASPPRKILSHLKQREAETNSLPRSITKPARREPYNIRLWRHVELAALKRLYDANTHHCNGALVRGDAYWRWLVSRWGKQRIYVAINGPDRLELDEHFTPIVAYAATRDARIVELMCSADHPEASVQLLRRACADSIERDFGHIRLDAPPREPLHQLVSEAGGDYAYHEADHGMVFMANIREPDQFLRFIGPHLIRRAKESGLPHSPRLGLSVDKNKYRLCLSRRSVNLSAGRLGRSYLKCSRYELDQLLLGHVNVEAAVAAGRLKVSTRVALDTAKALFPQTALWRPPWDDLPAS